MIPEHIKEALLHSTISFTVDDEGVAVVRLDFADDEGLAFSLFDWLSDLAEDSCPK